MHIAAEQSEKALMAECVLKSVSLVEKHANEVARLCDLMDNFQMQLQCVEKHFLDMLSQVLAENRENAEAELPGPDTKRQTRMCLGAVEALGLGRRAWRSTKAQALMAECVLKSVSLVEKHANEVARLCDLMDNFQMQLQCVEKVPIYCAMAQCSSRWRPKLMAKLHAECTQICEEYAQHWVQMDDSVASLSEYLILLRTGQRTPPSSTHIDDLAILLEHMRKESAKFHSYRIQDSTSFPREAEFDFDVRQAVQRIRADLSVPAVVPS
ncbi:hypothetical protein Tcan_10361 [Toxocara canis]|uniref:Uncharacterized protein n=1 Tax=Toxocara canis TaxID=6265 RepID=A0A0B2VXZ7_TOXCA|nr:hypothetical protein Tcan_10361 [Toxocara canis]